MPFLMPVETLVLSGTLLLVLSRTPYSCHQERFCDLSNCFETKVLSRNFSNKEYYVFFLTHWRRVSCGNAGDKLGKPGEKFAADGRIFSGCSGRTP